MPSQYTHLKPCDYLPYFVEGEPSEYAQVESYHEINGDGFIYAISNIQSIVRDMLKKYPDCEKNQDLVAHEYTEGGYKVGGLYVRLGTEVASDIDEIMEKLDGYPVYDEDDYSQVEMDEISETFENNRSSMISDLAAWLNDVGYHFAEYDDSEDAKYWYRGEYIPYNDPTEDEENILGDIAYMLYEQDCSYCGFSNGWIDPDNFTSYWSDVFYHLVDTHGDYLPLHPIVDFMNRYLMAQILKARIYNATNSAKQHYSFYTIAKGKGDKSRMVFDLARFKVYNASKRQYRNELKALGE